MIRDHRMRKSLSDMRQAQLAADLDFAQGATRSEGATA